MPDPCAPCPSHGPPLLLSVGFILSRWKLQKLLQGSFDHDVMVVFQRRLASFGRKGPDRAALARAGAQPRHFLMMFDGSRKTKAEWGLTHRVKLHECRPLSRPIIGPPCETRARFTRFTRFPSPHHRLASGVILSFSSGQPASQPGQVFYACARKQTGSVSGRATARGFFHGRRMALFIHFSGLCAVRNSGGGASGKSVTTMPPRFCSLRCRGRSSAPTHLQPNIDGFCWSSPSIIANRQIRSRMGAI
ncbi:hypothetical protein QBC40DRAFT_300732 [Triangularia verruculosa]|uniref:Uncharacterized protein n=1 Tax=Triangularia verruculosa TaxID=2587418 RepID=A0AAN6X874_9PEZI|nr:hypothetical protein QBC40DRAFT_300732 [Triangularia verruculosa]